jgi:hypothetical protein
VVGVLLVCSVLEPVHHVHLWHLALSYCARNFVLPWALLFLELAKLSKQIVLWQFLPVSHELVEKKF